MTSNKTADLLIRGWGTKISPHVAWYVSRYYLLVPLFPPIPTVSWLLPRVKVGSSPVHRMHRAMFRAVALGPNDAWKLGEL